MSYNLRISVKVQDLDRYVDIARPKYDNPTYNLGTMFRKCMDWDYSQSEEDKNGKWHTCYYRCDDVLKYVADGIYELIVNRKEYKQYELESGWGSLDDALEVLRSIRDCINETIEERNIPIEYLYFSW